MKHLPRILIVEDEPAIAELIAVNLRHGGFNPVIVGDSVAAQKSLDEVLPDAILLDWMLPGQSGLALARQWRKVPRTKGIPILMLTSESSKEMKIEAKAAGANGLLVKPFDPKKLLDVVQKVIGL